MEYYPVIKRSEVMMHATTSVNLEITVPGGKYTFKRPHIIWFHVYELSSVSKQRQKAGRGG